MDRESIRRNFRPSKIRVLFVGESPPANGAFFHVGSPMTNFMAQVFAQVHGREYQSLNDFLGFFMAEGCYLDDLSYEPVDNLRQPERRNAVYGCVGALAERMKEYQPEHVIAVLKSIEAPVRRSAHIAKLQVPVHAVPFPGHGNQRRFVVDLAEILKSIYEPAPQRSSSSGRANKQWCSPGAPRRPPLNRSVRALARSDYGEKETKDI